MHITLADPSTLRITNMGEAYDTLTTLPGAHYDRESQSLLVSLCHLRRLVTGYPLATATDLPGMIQARLAMWRRWMIQHNHAGVWFSLADDLETVVPTGPGVSPLFVEHVAGLSGVLVQFLGGQVDCAPVVRVTSPIVEPSHGDRLVWAGIENARKAEERKAAVVGRVMERRRMVQGSFSDIHAGGGAL
jgi:hypothetical protein